jgi:hypothetical protein
MLPNLLVIGATKAGTTSLWHYLNTHPEIFMSPGKELHFFDHDECWSLGPAWYAEQFAGAEGHPVVGEATPGYTRFPHRAYSAERAAATVPDARLIYLVREPIERMRSHYRHELRHGREQRDFAEAVLANPLYLEASRYALQLGRWAAHYPRESFLVVESDRMRNDQAPTLELIYRFVDVDPTVRLAPVALNESARALRSSPRSQRLNKRRSVRCLVGVTPARVRRTVKARIRAREHAQALAASVTPELRSRLEEELRPDVAELASSWMPADFTGWGLL